MGTNKFIQVFILCLPLALIWGCAKEVFAPRGIESGPSLEAAAKMSDTLVYVNQQIDQKKYAKFILEPVAVYEGEDSDFGKIDIQERRMMADFIRDEFMRAFDGSNFPIVKNPGEDVLKVKFTLIGLTRSIPVVQGLNYAAWPVGTGVQVVKGALQKPGTFMGNAILAAEFYDSMTDDVVASVVTKQSANALNFKAALSGKYGAAKAGITDFMEIMRKQADEAHGFKTD